MNEKSRNTIAVTIAILLFGAGIFLIYERNGVLAWAGLVLGAGLALKFWLRPSGSDLPVSLLVSGVWTLAWFAIFYYVISTWETGEVVELNISTASGSHSARTWIMEDPDAFILYYDAPEQAAAALLAGASLTVARGNAPLIIEGYSATRVDDLPQAEVDRLFGLMTKKYGARNAATDIYYGFLGQPRGNTGVVVKLKTEGSDD